MVDPGLTKKIALTKKVEVPVVGAMVTMNGAVSFFLL